MSRGEINVHGLVLSNLCGDWLRTPWVRCISQQCAKRHRSSNMNETPLYLKQFWLAISMPHCHHSSCPSSPYIDFFFFFSGAGGSTPMETERVSPFFFFLGSGRNNISCSIPSAKPSKCNTVQLGSSPEGQGSGIRRLWYSALVCGLIVSFSWSQRKLSIQRSQWACSGNRWNHYTQPMGQLYRVRQSTKQKAGWAIVPEPQRKKVKQVNEEGVD